MVLHKATSLASVFCHVTHHVQLPPTRMHFRLNTPTPGQHLPERFARIVGHTPNQGHVSYGSYAPHTVHMIGSKR